MTGRIGCSDGHGELVEGRLEPAAVPFSSAGNRLGTQKTGIYVTCQAFADDHPMAQRYRPQYRFVLRLVWLVKNPVSPIAEGEQANLDAAVGLLLQRIRGHLGDKTRGGRFLSVAEVPMSSRLRSSGTTRRARSRPRRNSR